MRVLTAMKHELLRYGLIQLIKDVHPIESMVMSESAEELVYALKQYAFDLIVIDVRLAGPGGLRNIVSLLETQAPGCKKVFMYTEPVRELEDMLETDKLDGLFYEQSSLNELMVFFEKVISGEKSILKVFGDENIHGEEIPSDLSPREEEIFTLKVRGYSVLDSAKLLNISVKTVENHRRNIKKKLNIKKNHEWYEWGKRLGNI
ncbi:response regulator transcription factor [Salipaludibacillus aurantiacus]|uniref:Two-component system, NarL family, invasion response regulator UvrY/two-component system, NarL family, response regulator NreC n=1 Tax=Salipaludibacillus aurantiacus TaxID=1601833 RepID=A0A1H9RQR5_9BACI|nr:LuxR C-terminal-related transcriptional regulator [Salipaludibacillus aurantiacus]SER74795.1 two-component system, NarL family, invasion response regulator UvrY/two-component system, NarL family, response regulator NreC [Salipaludibacillus aurantiacus]